MGYRVNGMDITTLDRKAFVFMGYNVKYDQNFFDKERLVSLKQVGSEEDVTSFGVPGGITRIGSRVFAFYELLRSVDIPLSVEYIEEKAFAWCRSLMEVNFINDVYNARSNRYDFVPYKRLKIGDEAFRGCECLNCLFSNNRSRRDRIPSGIESIGKMAFADCSSLKNLSIDSSVKQIGENAFLGIPHIEYYGTATGAPWGAKSMN